MRISHRFQFTEDMVTFEDDYGPFRDQKVKPSDWNADLEIDDLSSFAEDLLALETLEEWQDYLGIQPIDPTLSAIAALDFTQDTTLYATGPDEFALMTVTPFARSILDDANAAAVLATIGAMPASYLDTDATLAANSDTRVPSQKAIKTYVDQSFDVANALRFQDVIDCSTNPNYPAAEAGYVWIVSVAGKIGGASGINVEVGDMLICRVDGSPAGNQATVGANWTIVQSNIDGAVIGPASATDGYFAAFDGASGKLIKARSPSQVRTDLGLVIGTDVQAYDPELAALASLTSAANKLPYFTGSGTAAVTDLSAYMRTVLPAADAAAARTLLGVGSGTGDVIGPSPDPSTDNAIARWDGTDGQHIQDSLVLIDDTGFVTAPGYGMLDTDESHVLDLVSGENLSANRTLTLNTGNADRSISLGGNLTLGGALTTAGAVSISAFAATILDDADAAAVRTTLGLVIGTDVQAYDADLATIAGLAPTNNNTLQFISGAWTNRTPSQVRTTLGLVIGTDVQAYDAELAAIAGLTSAADKGIYFTGSGTAATYDLTSFARTLLDDADGAAMMTTLGAAPLAGGKNLTGGFTTDVYDDGTKSSGTFTPSPLDGAIHKCVNGGAFTLAPYTTKAHTLVLDVTNNGSAGAITTSGFTKVTGDAFDTTDTHGWRCFISYGQLGSHLHVQAMF